MYTVSGKCVDSLNIDPGLVNVYDIAWSLHHQNRYLGHTVRPFSVLSHLGLINVLYMKVNKGNVNPEELLALMLHDSAEAYLGDIIRPFKYLDALAGYQAAEEAALRVIYQRFGLDFDSVDWGMIEKYDRHALYVESTRLSLGWAPQHQIGPEFGDHLCPQLILAKPREFAPYIKDLALQVGRVSDTGPLFEQPDKLTPYLDDAVEEIFDASA
jgi:hypothetical protein